MQRALLLDGSPQPRPACAARPAATGEGPLQRYLGDLLRQGMDIRSGDACLALQLESFESADDGLLDLLPLTDSRS